MAHALLAVLYHSMRFFLVLLLLSFLSSIADASSWIELGPNGNIIARSLTSKAQCPPILLDKKIQSMQIRVPATANFPITVCEAHIPANTHHASIENQTLALPKADIKRIIVIGDTGCRLKDNLIQACNDPKQWPFKKIADTAARWQPDLVIHVGDYYYREMPCPASNKGCANSPYGKIWASWDADFFTPAKSLLKAAPWVMARGNHENCAHGDAWFRFLDPTPYTNTCQDDTTPYFVPIGDVTLFILDSATADDFMSPDNQVKEFIRQLQLANQINAANIWLVTHKPFWFVARTKPTLQNIQQQKLNALQAAAQNNLSPQIKLLLAGHIHRFETLNFNDGRPPQIIVGNSGTQLDKPINSIVLKGWKTAHATIDAGLTWSRFGYLTLEKTSDGWLAQPRDVNGKILVRCLLKDKQFRCTQALN